MEPDTVIEGTEQTVLEFLRSLPGANADHDARLNLATQCFAALLGDFEGSVVIHIQNGEARKADVTKVHRFKN